MSHGGTTTINNATITGNTADSDGDSDGDGGAWSGGSLTLSNSIVAGNVDGSPGAEDPDCDGAITSNGHNILGIDAGCTFTPDVGDKVGTTGAPIDPMIGPLADNGGAYQTHALLSGSPAIDAGSTLRSAEADTACTATDSRGVPRGLGGRCDMGSYELVRCMGTVVNRVGTSGDDRLVGTGGADGFLAFEGDDRLLGRGGPDRMCAGPGKDRLKGGGGNDRLRGQGGRDVLIGGGGNDRLIGGPGPDVCKGGGGKKDRARSCKVRRGIP
jgi:Ca2+-binding RTX toxin-like protein